MDLFFYRKTTNFNSSFNTLIHTHVHNILTLIQRLGHTDTHTQTHTDTHRVSEHFWYRNYLQNSKWAQVHQDLCSTDESWSRRVLWFYCGLLEGTELHSSGYSLVLIMLGIVNINVNKKEYRHLINFPSTSYITSLNTSGEIRVPFRYKLTQLRIIRKKTYKITNSRKKVWNSWNFMVKTPLPSNH